jgi:hypothetical protein
MSIVEKITEQHPTIYKETIKSRILDKTLEIKVAEYNTLQSEYDKIIRNETVNAKPSSGGWERIQGNYKQVSAAGTDYIWGVDENDNVSNCKKPCGNSNWQKSSEALKQLTGGENEVWGVNSSEELFKNVQDGSGNWIKISGAGYNISQGGGYVWVVGYWGTTPGATYYCREPCNGAWQNGSNPSQGIILTQLSCNDTYVFGLDNNHNTWRRPIDGSGTWQQFGIPSNSQFSWINASSNNNILAIGLSGEIYETDMNGKTNWSNLYNQPGKALTVSGDSDNQNIYITTNNYEVYKHSPQQAGGYWDDIPNENYMYDMVQTPGQSTEDWKYLGKTKNSDECKLKAVEDIKNEYSNVVYTSNEIQGIFKGTCYGNIKGGKNNPHYDKDVITSLSPNGTSRLGGEAGQKILKQLKNKANEIEDIIKQQKTNIKGVLKTNNKLVAERNANMNKLENTLNKLKQDRIKINNMLKLSNDSATSEDGYQRQLSNYSVYFLWIILVIISIVLAIHLITRDDVSVITYIFIGIWTLILCKVYYNQVIQYVNKTMNYISSILT